jgi:hypothetical protein
MRSYPVPISIPMAMDPATIARVVTIIIVGIIRVIIMGIIRIIITIIVVRIIIVIVWVISTNTNNDMWPGVIAIPAAVPASIRIS